MFLFWVANLTSQSPKIETWRVQFLSLYLDDEEEDDNNDDDDDDDGKYFPLSF